MKRIFVLSSHAVSQYITKCPKIILAFDHWSGGTISISGTLDCREVGRGFHSEAAGALAQSAERFAWLQRGRRSPIRFSGCGTRSISRPGFEILKPNWGEIRD